MNIAIVTNMNGIGLERDFEILRDILVEHEHAVTAVQFDVINEAELDGPMYDLAIFLEVAPLNLMCIAPVKWIFANPEWCKPDRVKAIDAHFDKIFAKTREAERQLRRLFGNRVFYTGFMARDRLIATLNRRWEFLHVGGNSAFRGTQAVIDAWRWQFRGEEIDAHLTVVGTAKREVAGIEDDPRIEFLERIDDFELQVLQNINLFFLHPAGTEGFGHALHEALSCGAIVLTTDAPPMNEVPAKFLVPSVHSRKFGIADVHEVSAIDIHFAAKLMRELPYNEAMKLSDASRSFYEAEVSDFKANFDLHLHDVLPKPRAPRRMRKGQELGIAFIGNFRAAESTENMIKWALERLGHQVDLLQENEINLATLEATAMCNDILLWVRTPGWLQIENLEMMKLFGRLANNKVKTMSVHLDKFWGIPEREALIGKHPFWMTDKVFTADGSHQEQFKTRGVTHHWMRPAVSEVYCHPGTPQPKYECDVMFVGAKDYHREYPFRLELVTWLEKTYRDRFKHITGVRGHELNDVYASAKVVVGDCIFAGIPHYWSDRLPETCGRYGFLLHPLVEGMHVPTPTYVPQDLQDLERNIDYFLSWTEKARWEVQDMAAKHVLKNDTWTVRMRQLLEAMA